MSNFAAYQNLICPSCGNSGPMMVKDSRAVSSTNQIRRRRQCRCGHRFTTYERIDGDGPPKVDVSPVVATLERTVAELKRRLS